MPDKGKKYTYIKYVISNLKNDTNVNFQYQSEFKNLDFNTQNLANPIKICKGDTEEQCEENIEMFVFKKDTVYSIYVNFEKREIENKNYYVLTGYSFKDINRRDYDEDRDDEDESEDGNDGGTDSDENDNDKSNSNFHAFSSVILILLFLF